MNIVSGLYIRKSTFELFEIDRSFTGYLTLTGADFVEEAWAKDILKKDIAYIGALSLGCDHSPDDYLYRKDNMSVYSCSVCGEKIAQVWKIIK